MGLIAVDRFECLAPDCFLVCEARPAKDWRGLDCYEWDVEDAASTRRIEIGPEWIVLACCFGWKPPNRPGQTESDLITEAERYLDEVIKAGRVIEDPGYFKGHEGREEAP